MEEKIKQALHKRWIENRKPFEITMKASGNKYSINLVITGPHRSCGKWHGRKHHIEVTCENGEVKYFKDFDTLAKAIAYGYVK